MESPQTALEIDAALPEYAEGLREPHRHKCLYGGRGGSKTWTVARQLLLDAHESPLRVLCAREIQNSIRDSVHRTLVDQSAFLGLPYLVTDNEIRHPNGSLFIFKGLRTNVESIKSLEGIDRCWVEEANRVSKPSWDILLPTIRKSGSEIWVTFNTGEESDPAYQMFVVNPLPDTWTRKVGWEDNPWFHELTDLIRLRDHAYATDPDAAANIWGGEPSQATDAQILRGKWLVREFETRQVWHGPYYGADFGFAVDPSACVKCWVEDCPQAGLPNLQRLYVEYESYHVGLELDDTAQRWKMEVPGCEEHIIRADSARPESISYLKRHGLPHIVGAVKGEGSVKDGIAHLRQYERIVIHPRCVNTQAEAKNYKYKVDERTGEVIQPTIIIDKWNHAIDALRYALQPLIRLRPTIQRRQLPTGGNRTYMG